MGYNGVSSPLVCLKDARLYVKGGLASQDLFSRVKQVLRYHRIPDIVNRPSRQLVEALLFCIGSQHTPFERAVAFARSLQSVSESELWKENYLAQMGSEAGLLFTDRFGRVLEFVQKYQGGIEGLAEDFLNSPLRVRRELMREKVYLAPKTASFWYLCIGGNDLMTLDRHALRQARGFGLQIPRVFTRGRLRPAGRYIVDQPRIAEYEKLEARIIDRATSIPELRNGGKANAALVTVLLWMLGVEDTRSTEDKPHRLLLEPLYREA